MRSYDYLLKTPFLLALLALIIWCFIGIDIYRQIPIFIIIGIFYTFKNKAIMSQGFKLKFALYFTILFALRNIIVLYQGMHDPWGSVGIITSLPFIAIALPAQVLIAFVSSYISLLITNRICLLLVKISELKSWIRYATKPFIFLAEQPKYILISLSILFLFQFTYKLIYYEKGKFEFAGELDNYDRYIKNLIAFNNNNVFIIKPKQYSIYDDSQKRFISGGFFKQVYSGSPDSPKGIMLDNKKILILGQVLTPKKKSTSSKVKTYAEFYDTTTNSTTLSNEIPSLNYSFAATKLLDGRILIVGGAGMSNKIEIYNPQTNKFIPAGNLKEGRWGHALAVLKNGNVLIIGGYANIAEIYDPQSLKIIKTFPYKTNSWGSSTKAITLNDGRVFIAYKGKQPNPELGNTPISYTSIYNPKNNTIQELRLKYNNQNIDDFDATLLKNGKILITGGKVPRGKRRGYLVLNTAEVFDPQTNKFIPLLNKMKVPRYSHKTATLENGHVLIIGGVNNKQFGIKENELFIPLK